MSPSNMHTDDTDGVNPQEVIYNQSVDHNQGVVVKKTIGNYHVSVEGDITPCALSSRLRKQLVYPSASPHSLRPTVREVKAIEHIDPVAIGDQVCFIEAQDGTGLIVDVLPRRNRLARRTAVPMPSAHAFEQVIVANVDQVVAVFAAAKPAPKWNMLDRYLVSAESLDLPSLICITKLDLVRYKDHSLDAELSAAVEEYSQIGYHVILTSVVSGEGIAELQKALRGRVSVLVGKSGVGKTSLLNVLQPDLGLRVGEVNQRSGKGRHTTAHLEMFPLAVGGAIVDTPGVREFGPWGVDQDDLALHFPEMRSYVGKCKFRLGCQHDEEPGCAVRKAVISGEISPRRYQSYMRLKADVG